MNADNLMKEINFFRKRWPHYESILNFYGQIFLAQENSRPRIGIQPFNISGNDVSGRNNKFLPLIKVDEFAIDEEQAGLLLEKLISIAQPAHKEVAVPAETIGKALKNKKIDASSLFSDFLKSDKSYFKEIEESYDINCNTLSFLIYNSIKPSLSACAQKLTKGLPEKHGWNSGTCPVCGSAPVLSLFGEGGKRFLVCSFCWHTWPVQRIYCSFCQNQDTTTLRYYFSDQKDEYRIDVCNKCKYYIKSLDQREIERIIYPPLENIATPHLDLKAMELGFRNIL